MWAYEKKLQYPVKIKNPNANYAKIIISQLGGADDKNRQSIQIPIASYNLSIPQNKQKSNNYAIFCAKITPGEPRTCGLARRYFYFCFGKRRVIAPIR